jgi:serine/threonine protein phosphatase PrpC
LSRLLSTEEIQNLMQTNSLEESVQTMIHTALVRGAPDNVTVISVQSDDDQTVVF